MNVKAIMNAVLVLLALLLSNCDESDPVTASSCSFTFKGSSVSLPNVVCGTPQPGVQTVSSSNTSGSQLLGLTKGNGVNAIVWTPVVSASATTYFADNASITISGNTWSFSGTLENVNNGSDTGTISGKCTCKN